MNQIEQKLLLNKQVREQIENIRERHGYTASQKNDLLMAYFDINIEHHESIHVLIEKNLIGSSFALVRPVAETLNRALWVNICAKPEEVEQILKDDDFKFPNDMMKQIDAAYSTQGFFQNLKRTSWASMCSYAHSGLLQISRRFYSDGSVGANYSEEEILEVLEGTTILLLFTGLLFFKSAVCDTEASEIELLITSHPPNK